MPETLAKLFAAEAPSVEYWSLRIVDAERVSLAVRQDVAKPPAMEHHRGAMVTVVDQGGIGYAATGDASVKGLLAAADRARSWAHRCGAVSLVTADCMPRVHAHGRYETPVAQPWADHGLSDKLDWLADACKRIKVDGRIVDWQAGLEHTFADTLIVTSEGGWLEQRFSIMAPRLIAVANEGGETQVRTNGFDAAWQGGMEVLAGQGLSDQAHVTGEEAVALLEAPQCPTGTMDVLLMPSQMALQIHESIGHPLELDRILGDERNYAGTSFVTTDMFGRYQYGSELLNVTFDPDLPQELASYRYDDEGSQAGRTYLIRDGILERPLGGAVSQARAGLPGVACARASGWNRAPIDRMANLNVEPGDASFEALVGSVERGVLMETNRSWSIDDSRNKFQFGCELGRLIEDGQIKGLVRDPSYRGQSAQFWRSLDGVGDSKTFQVRGVPTCGKGEPNQLIHAGHAAPACLFRDVSVFGPGRSES